MPSHLVRGFSTDSAGASAAASALRGAQQLAALEWVACAREGALALPLVCVKRAEPPPTAAVSRRLRPPPHFPQVLRNMQASSKLKYKGTMYAVHRLVRFEFFFVCARASPCLPPPART